MASGNSTYVVKFLLFADDTNIYFPFYRTIQPGFKQTNFL